MSESLDDKNTLSLSPEEVEETVDDVEMSMDRLHQEVEEEEEVVIEDETYEVDQEDHIEYKIIEDDDDERYEEVEEEEEEDVDDETSVLKNGLDPLATSLISSSNLGSQEKDEEEGGEDDDDEEEEIKMVESGELSENVENGDYIETRVEEEEDGIIIPKISREVKNLQITTNESSDIISNFLFDTPRRSKKVVEIPPDDEEIEEDDEKSEKETSKSPSIERLAVSSTSDSRRESIKSTRGRSRSVSKSRSPMKSKSSKKSEISTDDYASDTEELQNNDDESESEAFSERSISRISIDDRKINSPPKPGWDSFCFKCHNDQAVLSLPCSTCKCSYHRNCVRPNPIPRNVDEFVCPECREMETAEKSPTNKYGHERIELKKLSEMLRLILRKTMEGHTPEEFKNEIVLKKESNYPMIVTNMSFLIMESRIKENYYTTSERFIHDLRQLEHNWNVVDRTKAKLLKPILKMVISEINELESCVYCYEDSFNYTDWFVRVCKRPHLLVWAKLKGYPFWPAKIMSIDVAKQQADVRFFGAHDRAWIQSTQCLVFCENDPNKFKENASPAAPKMASKTQKGFLEAIKEKDDYILNLKSLYGFQSAPFKTLLDVNNLQGQLDSMLPSLKDKTQKEKLTLKIKRQSSSNKYEVEGKKSEKSSIRENKSEYKVIREENDENSEQSKKLNLIILKRKVNHEQDIDKPPMKKQKSIDESEQNITTKNLLERKIVQKRGPRNGKKKSIENLRKLRKSIDVRVPLGTNEIKQLKDDSEKELRSASIAKSPPIQVPLKGRKRAQSTFHRRSSVDREVQNTKQTRRLSGSSEIKADKAIEIVKANQTPAPYIKTRASSIRKSLEKSKDKTSSSESPTPPISTAPKRGRKPWKNIPTNTISVEEDKKPDSKNETSLVEIPVVPVTKKRGPKSKEKASVTVKEVLKAPDEQTRAEPVFKEPTPEKIANGNSTKDTNSTAKTSATNNFIANLTIKTEPISDTEESNENESQKSFITQDPGNNSSDRMFKRNVYFPNVDETDTSSSSNNHHHNSNARARKTFVNSISLKQVDKLSQNKNENWMVSIPHDIASAHSSRTHSPANSASVSNRSSPLPTTETSTIITNQSSIQVSSNPIANVTPLNYSSPIASRKSTPQTSPISMKNTLPPPQIAVANPTRSQENSLPRLVPRPIGVFTQDGSNFTPDLGPVSRMLTDNSHRIADYFKTVLVDTVNSFSTQFPEAENLVLRSEKEKLIRDMQNVKSDCQLKMQELRKEHQEEMESIKRNYEERIANLQNMFENEKKRMRQEIRHQCELEKQRAIDITKKELKNTTWCASCKKEARFYCCWNTSYCGQSCQKMHWQHHQKHCTNKNSIQDVQQPVQQQQLQHQQIIQQQIQNQLDSHLIQLPQIQNLPIINNHRVSHQQPQTQLITVRPPQQMIQQQINKNTNINQIQPMIIQQKHVISPPSQQISLQQRMIPNQITTTKQIIHPQHPQQKIIVQQIRDDVNIITTSSMADFLRVTNTLSNVTSTTTGQE